MSDWYYRKQGLLDETTEGPISDAAFLQLAFDGKIKLDTLVTHEKRTNGQWVTVGQIPAARKKLDEGAEVRRQAKEHAAAEAAKVKEEKRIAAAELKQQRLLTKEAERQAQAAEKQAKAARIEAERAARTPPPMPQQSPFGVATIQQHPAAATVHRIAPQPESVLLRVHPSMIRNSPITFLICCGLCFIGIGIPILALWWWSCLAKTLIVSNERTTLRSGILNTRTSEVWHRDVRNVVIDQKFLQRIFGVGSVGIASAGHAGIEIYVSGIPDPERVKQIIDDVRRQTS